MNEEARKLIESERWRQFLESTAAALRIHLVFQVAGTDARISVCDTCRVCHAPLSSPDFSAPGGEAPRGGEKDLTAGGEADYEMFYLNGTYRVTVRCFPCCATDKTLSLREKACIANELLGSFLVILTDQWNVGQLATELAVLRQINHIILSMFRGENNALEHVLDLILSAAVILCDASGSLLEYTKDGRRQYVTKGCLPASDGAALHTDNSLKVAISSPAIQGTLGLIDPVNTDRAETFLSFMAQECVIVFEIDSLLQVMESKLSIILSAVDNLVLLVDKRKNICYVNSAATDIFGRPVQELLEMRAGDLDVPWSDCIASGIKTTAKGVKDPVTLDGKSIVLLDWEVYPLTGGEDIPGWLVIARDRTDYYRLQELGERVERLVKSSDLLNVMAHEIRNPLATFKGLLQIIELKDNSPDIKKYVSIGMREVNRLSLLLDEYMQLGKSAAISLERTEPGAFLGEVMPVLDMEFSSENVGFKTEFSETAPVLIDKRQMTQVIINLVKNAYEAIDRQGTITISLRQLDKNWVELTVSDTGPGIPEHIKKKLFRQYFTTKPQGTGLGLAVSHTIIQNHGGELSVHNNAGGGACFTIRLPICPAEPAGQVRKTDVLLITDDDMIRLPALHVFKAENINAFSISRPVNVMAAIERYDPLVIFIDEDFLEPGILKNLTQNICAENAKLKILIASDRVWESPIDNVCHIGKPVNYYKLVQLIKTLLEDNEHAVLGA